MRKIHDENKVKQMKRCMLVTHVLIAHRQYEILTRSKRVLGSESCQGFLGERGSKEDEL